MVRRGRGAKQPGLALAGRDRLSRVEMESQRFLIGGSTGIDATYGRGGERNQSHGPLGCAAKHFWRGPLLSSGIRKKSFPPFSSRADLVFAPPTQTCLCARG